MIQLFFAIFFIVIAYMITWFFIAMAKKRNDVADIAWGLGFIVIAITSLIMARIFSNRALLTTMMVIVWGTRLAVHIGSRHSGKPEDARYAKWRQEWGKTFVLRSFLQVFVLQGILLTMVAFPIIMINTAPPSSFTIFDIVGIWLWFLGFTVETVSDWQLAKFTKVPFHKGQIMTTGLWKYSRHPNYFGEVALWWGIYIIALSIPSGWISIIGPLTITVLILKVSGIPMLEAGFKDNPAFQQYKQRTSAFFPLPPRKE
jgi:steroid 5-alpha reductase family enzyme